MSDLRQNVTENQHAILDIVASLPRLDDAASLEFAVARAKQALRTTNAANALIYAREAAARLIAWSDSRSDACTATVPSAPARPRRQPRLGGKRLAQLLTLHDNGAISRETAVAAALTPGLYYPATLRRMVEEGLVHHGYFARASDPRRQLSHYWLTAQGAGIARDHRAGKTALRRLA